MSSRVHLLRQLIDPRRTTELVAEVLSATPRRVSLAPGEESWLEYPLAPETELARCLLTSDIEELVANQLGRPIASCCGWLSVYAPGEFIDWHCDTGGDTQLVVTLEQPEPDGEGRLLFEAPHDAVELSPGDAVLFQATQIRHRTTASAHGWRISAAMRFLVANK